MTVAIRGGRCALMKTFKTKDQCQWSEGQMVRAYATVTSLSNGRGNVGEGKGGCIRMAKEKSALGPPLRLQQLPTAPCRDQDLTQLLRDTSQSHSKGAHLRREGFKAVTGFLAPQRADSTVSEIKATRKTPR